MADIELRFHKDVLVLSSPIDYALSRQGFTMPADWEYLILEEPETLLEALRPQALAGAQCLVAPTEDICEARLAHRRMEDQAAAIAASAIEQTRACVPQHLICEVGACGLPLDASSAASRKQTMAQYERAVGVLEEAAGEDGFDAVLLSGLRSAADISCAIEGARRATQRPVFVSVDVGDQGAFAGAPLEAVLDSLAAADVVGVRSAADAEATCAIVRRLAARIEAPILVELDVAQPTAAEKRRASLGGPIAGKPYALPDSLADAAVALRAAGAQFLRARGEATPAYTGALCVAALGLDTVR